MLSKISKVHPGKISPPPIFKIDIHILMTDDEISPWGGICVWQGTGDFWLLGGLLDCFWYK